MHTPQWQHLLRLLTPGDIQALPRCISLAENAAAVYKNVPYNLPPSAQPIIGITGAPGAGKAR